MDENWSSIREREIPPGSSVVQPIVSSPQVAGISSGDFRNAPISSGTGDIILAPEKKGSKKWLFLVFGILAALLIGVGVFLFLYFTSASTKIAGLLRENVAGVQTIEQVFFGSYYGDLTVKDIFTQEKHNEINVGMERFKNLRDGLAEYDESDVAEKDRTSFKLIKERLDSRVQHYQKSVDFYNILFSAYTENESSPLADLLTSEDYYTALIAERFFNFINDQKSLTEKINQNGCMDYANTVTCETLLGEYAENTESLETSTVVVSAIFNTEDTVYIESELIVPQIKNIIGEDK